MIEFIHTLNVAYVLSGFVVGVLVGLTGIGGGSLMTPLLILVFGVPPATAVGTDLLYAAITKSGGALFHGVARSVDWRVVGRLAAGSLPMTTLTLLLLSKVDRHGTAAGELIRIMLSIALFLTVAVLIFRKYILEYYAARVAVLNDRRTAVCTIVMGAVIGILVSISSVGAGAIGAMGLVLLYPRMPMARIVGSDIAHAVPLTLVAGIGHWWLGSTDWHLLASLLVGSLPGIFLGSYFCSRVTDGALRMILAVTLTVVAVRLLL
ncbi:MAG: TSUP family transporter [Rhizobiales bacterium]|nr:TSUP family transporter [Hyphomicrobiales bacterium]